ncbi:MAG: RNA methyltransferase [Spirochaetaceae bacterium]|jgi:tRNA/rRNA methyltransferase/tRNA (cytidine32/uridine32-2'-O)-methyltransferase|nr:RNA methyltransferase [Spirochaetaceae bacterium]
MTTSNIVIVLCRPSEAGNMGAVCRVMKNMNFSRLRLVAPVNVDDEISRARAVHAVDIWENAESFATLHDALAGCSFAAGITRRRGVHRKSSTMSARDLACFLRDRAAPRNQAEEAASPENREPCSDGRQDAVVSHERACGGCAALNAVGGSTASGRDTAALVFGNERTGLESEELALCDMASHIPVSGAFPSLNLSHAVQIYCYELFIALSGQNCTSAAAPDGQWVPLTRQELEAESENVYAALEKIGFYEHKENKEQLIFFRDLLSRAGITRREAGYLRNIILKAARLSEKAADVGNHRK